MTVPAWGAVALLGGFGAVARFLVDAGVSKRAQRGFPYGTLVINLSGSFILGVLSGAAVSGVAATLVGTATIGSFTTFSTWMFESHRLRDDGELPPAALNLVLSLLLGFAAAAFGRLLGTLL